MRLVLSFTMTCFSGLWALLVLIVPMFYGTMSNTMPSFEMMWQMTLCAIVSLLSMAALPTLTTQTVPYFVEPSDVSGAVKHFTGLMKLFVLIVDVLVHVSGLSHLSQCEMMARVGITVLTVFALTSVVLMCFSYVRQWLASCFSYVHQWLASRL